MFIIIHNKSKDLCCAYRCGNKRPKKDRFCPKHRKRYEKENKPLNYAFHTLRSNAKRRGKEFHLTLDDFLEFCQETGYLENKGKTPTSASIDRIDNSKGYEKGNIRILTLSENSIKGTKDLEDDDCPF